MSHVHSVFDDDIRFSIDPDTRVIKDSAPSKTKLVQYDHNSEVYTFELPRYVEGHDMTQCDKVEVWFNNGEVDGKLPITDLQISPDDESKVVFSWTVTRLSTQQVAPLKFQFYFRCTEDDKPTYEWHTAPYKRIRVIAGLGNEAELDLIEEQIQQYVEQRGYEVPAVTYMLVDTNGKEVPAVLVEEEVEVTATPNDIRLGTTAITGDGVVAGEKEIPPYYVNAGQRIVTNGSRFAIPTPKGDYKKFQALICPFNETLDASVYTERSVINDSVYNVLSTEPIAAVSKKVDDAYVDLGTVNETGSIYLIRYFLYREEL